MFLENTHALFLEDQAFLAVSFHWIAYFVYLKIKIFAIATLSLRLWAMSPRRVLEIEPMEEAHRFVSPEITV